MAVLLPTELGNGARSVRLFPLWLCTAGMFQFGLLLAMGDVAIG